MSNVYVSFEDQKREDAELNLKAMGTQLGINLGISIVVLAGFSWLRPRHSLVYAPKSKFATPDKQPPVITPGWFAWIKLVYSATDDFLMDRIGYDAVLFLRTIRLFKNLLLIMSLLGICVLIPINIVATRFTGDWPPPPGLDFLSISGINYLHGKLRPDPDIRWYWSPFAATWIFSILIIYCTYRASNDYVRMRQRFFQQSKSDNTLLISGVPTPMRSDEKLKTWLQSFNVIQYPIQQALIGHHSSKLIKLIKEHEEAVHHLENALASYLNDGKHISQKRPSVKVGGWLGCGGRKVDAIEYYTKQVSDLDQEIKQSRHEVKKVAPYGWIAFDQPSWAHNANHALQMLARRLRKSEEALNMDVRISPPPNDLIWSNLQMDHRTRHIRRWVGRAIYWGFTLAWFIPIGALSATSNVINIIRLLPNSQEFIDNHELLMGVIQAWFTPIVMAAFFFLVPLFFRYLSQQQGYRAETTLDRKVFLKLYTFFIVNNLLVFTLISIFIGIYGQLGALAHAGSISNQEPISEYLLQLAKNIADVSTFWINYVCIKALGITMELAQLLPFIIITLRKWITRPSPRQLREFAQPPNFDYPQNYNLLLFFFTIGLVYSAIAPLVLPFALLYFVTATVVYKYMLMYIFVTKIESGGKMWPAIFQTMMISTILFQVIMIIILKLKGGDLQCYILIPLPVLTVVYQYFLYRRMHVLGSFSSGSAITESQLAVMEEMVPVKKKTTHHSLAQQFRDPMLHNTLSTPMIHDDVKHLLPKVYHHRFSTQQQIEMEDTKGNLGTVQPFQGQRDKNAHRLTVMQLDGGGAIQFNTVTENQVLEPEEEEEDRLSEASLARESLSPNPFSSQKSLAHSSLFQESLSHNATDDEFRGLVVNDHAESYWQQQQKRDTYETSVKERYSKYLESEEEEIASIHEATVGRRKTVDTMPILLSEGLQSLVAPAGTVGPARHTGEQQPRTITSELVDIYESWIPEEVSEKSEWSDCDSEDIQPLSLHEFGATIDPIAIAKRQSAPLLVQTWTQPTETEEPATEHDIPTIRRSRSLPNLQVHAEPTLLSDSTPPPVALQRQVSAPVQRIAHRKKRPASPLYTPLQRSKSATARYGHGRKDEIARNSALEEDVFKAVPTSLQRSRTLPNRTQQRRPSSLSSQTQLHRSRTVASSHTHRESNYRITYYDELLDDPHTDSDRDTLTDISSIVNTTTPNPEDDPFRG
ncbi:uncharacterized protein BYT42DRAFT_562165 [Radiomyces spectabilis]|uniref:uncharacterized protein n=1 Tax=Radiomyces spectabilis TaxID=64574 RepID=UPI00221F32F5|nr:uncharacterized protein BYT42DRAFT_562165 [Radiomyces spectabilis]KAI8384333.1 hypothetical protein BYT42DRAFT_562165 [Radiomyces spectabilis]